MPQSLAGAGRTLPCSLPQRTGEAALPPLPGQCPSWAQMLHLPPSLPKSKQALSVPPLLPTPGWRGSAVPEKQEAGPCSRSHRTQGPEVGSQDSGCPPVPLGSYCLPSTAVARCQELQSWPLSKTSPAPLNSERSPPGSDCREHSCRPLLSPQASAPRSGFLLSQSGPGEGQVEDTYTKVPSFPLLSFQRKELEGPESNWKAAHLTLSNFFFFFFATD